MAEGEIMTANRARPYQVGIIGRTLRLMLGLLLGWMAHTVMRAEGNIPLLRVLGIVLGLAVVYLVLHTAGKKAIARLNPWIAAAVALVPVVLVFLALGALGRVGSVAYAAISFLLQTVRADGSCVVMAIPAFISGRPSELPGILFSPIDLVEKHLTGPGGLPG